MDDNLTYTEGVAFIVEGPTEQAFYLEYLKFICSRHPEADIARIPSESDHAHVVEIAGFHVLVLFNTVNSISQMPNSYSWFENICCKKHPNTKWAVFLCYDTDEYNCPVSKFRDGDWDRLRQSIGAKAYSIVDLAAEADIEDIMLCDLEGVLSFLELPIDYEMHGRNGKAKMKDLFKSSQKHTAYHPGVRAKPLIQALDFLTIEAFAPVPMIEIKKHLFG